jgi:hypothetical protein
MTAGRSATGRREQPARCSTRCTVECDCAIAGSSARRRGLQPVRSRSSQIRVSSSAGTRPGERCGRLERSARHPNDARSSGDAWRQRRTQSQTVAFETFAQAAAWANVSPSSTTRRTTSQRPSGVWRALWCATSGPPLRNVSSHPHPLGRPGPISRRSERPRARHLSPPRRGRLAAVQASALRQRVLEPPDARRQARRCHPQGRTRAPQLHRHWSGR